MNLFPNATTWLRLTRAAPGLAVVGLALATSAASSADPPAPGTTVRLTGSGGPVVSSAVAVRDDTLVVAWNEVEERGSWGVWLAAVRDSRPRPSIRIDEALERPRRPAVVATGHGFLVAWEAEAAHGTVVRAAELDSNLHVTRPPWTVSAPGKVAARVSVAAAGDDLAFAWTGPDGFRVSRTGAVESFGPTVVGHSLQSPGLTTPPHLELTEDGRMLLAWIDGGPESYNRDVLVSERKTGGSFTSPVNVSRSPDLLSIDLDTYLDRDGALNLAWIQQVPDRVDRFAVARARRLPDGTVTEPRLVRDQRPAAWRPQVGAGLRVVWHSGGSRAGRALTAGPSPFPTPLVPSRHVRALSIAPDGAAFVFVDDRAPGAVHLRWLPRDDH